MGKIYTRAGDKGTTGLFGGKRVSKADLRIEVLGTIDELNSAIGVAIAETQNSNVKSQNYNSKLKSELTLIQNDLLDIGSGLANSATRHELPATSYLKRVKDFEDLIDKMATRTPPLKNFILPGGGRTGASLHLARAICRRAERRVVELVKVQSSKFKVQSSGDNLITYFNRLSDLLFTMARFVNFKEKKKEIVYKP